MTKLLSISAVVLVSFFLNFKELRLATISCLAGEHVHSNGLVTLYCDKAISLSPA
ncbi:MAG: hypothetical protein ABGX33_03400 [Cycloclasticus sp.]